MDLSERECARVLGLEEAAVRRLVRRGELAAARIGDERRIGRVDLLEWALSHGVALPADLFASPGDSGLAPALLRGGLGVAADDWPAALAALALPDRLELLLHARLARMFRIDAHGIALPRPRAPVILPIEMPQLHAAVVTRPQSLAGDAASVLFLVISPAVRTHLAMIARLATALGDGAVIDAIRAGADRERVAWLLGERSR